ncbi:hypothetical protein NPS42_25535 [Pseudomonas putida]|uniref:DUF6538 domain-containing protein n=1 Tax=Pseudomonas putida TaxID=303 RepID=UPI002364540A|nr:DUF6538 domain-containing protein [Pseudomonas putida]MDD2029148.1 hypothetical protein [Pseudomonas putida]HDS1769238.1 hypothetical protein [Pseudomonas putida]
MSYVTRRDGRYFYRRRFPADVAAIVGRAEFRKALGTADRKEALQLARVVSVEFDRTCAEALAQSADGGVTGALQALGGDAPAVTAERILERLRAVVDGATRSAVEALEPSQRQAPTWAAELEWRKAALQAIAEGKHPGAADYSPMEAMAALRALEALERGEVPSLGQPTSAPERPAFAAPGASADSPDQRTAADFAKALDGYCSRVSEGRAGIVRSLAARVLRWPSTPDEQVQRVMQFAAEKLAAGGKASSVHNQAAGLITVLRELPGWERVALPRNGAVARAVRQGGQLQADARDSMMLGTVNEVLRFMDQRGDAVDAAAARLLVRYGLRPLELLQEGPEALAIREDIQHNKELVFHAGLSGAKNSASRRSLPVHADDAALFRLVLADRGAADAKRARARVKRLGDAMRIALRGKPGKLSLYSLRHTCADLLRAAGATPDEVGGVLGHTAKGSKATSIYGGRAPLHRPRALLAQVRALLEHAAELESPAA